MVFALLYTHQRRLLNCVYLHDRLIQGNTWYIRQSVNWPLGKSVRKWNWRSPLRCTSNNHTHTFYILNIEHTHYTLEHNTNTHIKWRYFIKNTIKIYSFFGWNSFWNISQMVQVQRAQTRQKHQTAAQRNYTERAVYHELIRTRPNDNKIQQ